MFYSQKTKLSLMENLGVKIRSMLCDNNMFLGQFAKFEFSGNDQNISKSLLGTLLLSEGE